MIPHPAWGGGYAGACVGVDGVTWKGWSMAEVRQQWHSRTSFIMAPVGLGLTWLVIYLILCKGVRSVSRVVMITMPLPIVPLVLLLVLMPADAGSLP